MSTDVMVRDELPLVMLVDDEENILNSLKRLLRKEPYQVVSANSGVDGLRMLERISRRVAVIISDFRMPGMSGIEFLGKAREQCPETVRIVLSGYSDAATIQSAINEGHIYKLLSKPWNDDELKAVVLDSIRRYEKVRSTRVVMDEVNALRREVRTALADATLAPQQEAAGHPAQILPTVGTKIEHSSFALWQEIVNMIPSAIIGIDSDGLVVLANTRVQPILGLDQWSLLGTPAADALPYELAATVRPVVAGLVPGRTKKTTINGRELQIECVPLSGSLESKPRGALLLAFVLV